MEQLADVLEHHPRRRRLLGAHVEAAIDLQPRQHPDYRQLRRRQALHQAADLVLEELLLVQREKRNGLGMALGIGAGEAEIDLVAAAIQGHRLQPELCGAVLFLGERLRVDHLQLELATGRPLVGPQQLLDPPRIVAQRHQVSNGPIGIEELQLDGRLQLLENALGALGNGVELLLGQVQPGIGEQQAREDVEDQERQRDQQQPGTRINHSFHVGSLMPLSSDRRPRRWPPARRRSA